MANRKQFQMKVERVVFDVDVELAEGAAVHDHAFRAALCSFALPEGATCETELLREMPALEGVLRVVDEPALEGPPAADTYFVAKSLFSRLLPENALSLVLYVAVFRPLVDRRERSELVRRLRAILSSVVEVAREDEPRP